MWLRIIFCSISFAQKKSEKQPKKEKSPSKKEGTGEMPRSPSGGLVGPVAPSMKMKPLASLGGLAQPGELFVCEGGFILI